MSAFHRCTPLALALLLALGGCGGSNDSSSDADTQAAADAPVDAAAGMAQPEGASGPTWPPLPEGEAPRIDMSRALADNYYLVLDGSGSMLEVECSGRREKIYVAVDAIKHFIKQIPDEANIGLAVFDDDGLTERVPLGTGNRRQLARALDTVHAAGDTPLRSSIALAYGKIEGKAATQLGYGEYHLVVVTDGQPDPESEDPRDVVDQILAESPVVVHTVGFCLGEDHALNQPGRTYYAAADSPAELQKGLNAVLAEAPSFDTSSFEH
jgi:Mg-chelatase subunit ChlD